MARRHVTRILCAAEPRGSDTAIERLLEVAGERDVQAVAVVGDLGGGDQPRNESYRAVFKAIGRSELPAFWVPGPGDAPIGDYLREAHNIEVVFPFLHGVHGTAAFTPGYILVAGLGGEVDDDPDAQRDELERLHYPRWEAEYRLKIIRELQEHQLMLLFANPPAHKGEDVPGGAEVLAELVATHRPRLVVTGGERAFRWIGRSMIVAPGSLADGQYAIADIHTREVEMGQLAATAS